MTATQQFIEDAIKGGWKGGFKGEKPLHGGNEFAIYKRPLESTWYMGQKLIKEDTMHRGKITPANTSYTFNYGLGTTEKILLDPLAWQAVGRVRGWETSKYRACEMKMPFYHNEKMRGTGTIVGESKDGKQWYVRWDVTQSGKPTKNGGVRNPYPKENIIERERSENWRMVLHRFIDHLADGKTIEEALQAIT